MDIAYVLPGNYHPTKMWWDLENVSIPRDLQPDYLFRRIKHSLDMRGFHGSLEIKAIVAEDKSKKDVKDVHVVSMRLSSPRRNAAIVDDIVAFCEKEERRREPVNILIASGDKKVMLQAYSRSRRRNRTIVWLGVSVDTIEDPMPQMKALWTWRRFLLMEEEAPPKVPQSDYNELKYRNVGPLPWTDKEMRERVKRQKPAKEDDSDDDKDSEEEEETPKKPEPINKKRQNESASSVSRKKAKPAATPQKTEEKKKGGHTATPHPAKKGGKSPVNANQSPKSGGQSSGGNNKKPFNSGKQFGGSNKKGSNKGKGKGRA